MPVRHSSNLSEVVKNDINVEVLDDVDVSVPGGQVKAGRSLVVEVVDQRLAVDQTLN